MERRRGADFEDLAEQECYNVYINEQNKEIGMPLVPAKCCNCGANLQVNSEQDAAICSSCGTPFIIEKAINLFVNGHNGLSDFVVVSGVLRGYRGSSIDISIPEGVIEIGADVFRGQKYLRSVSFPQSVKVISNSAFNGCSSLRSVQIINNLESIGDCAFYGCSSLSNITLPTSLKYIGQCAFAECTSLTKVVIPNGRKAIIFYKESGYSPRMNNADPNCLKICVDSFFDNPNLELVLPSSLNQLERLAIGLTKNRYKLEFMSVDRNTSEHEFGKTRFYYDKNITRCFYDDESISSLIHNNLLSFVFMRFSDGDSLEKCCEVVDIENFKKCVSYSFKRIKTNYTFESKYENFSEDIETDMNMLKSLLISSGVSQYSIQTFSSPIYKQHWTTVQQIGSRKFLSVQIPVFTNRIS